MTLAVQRVSKDELVSLVNRRCEHVRGFLEWAELEETKGTSMYVVNRPDIEDARAAADLFPDPWWGIVVFSCFGSLNSVRAVCDALEVPVDGELAEELLTSIRFSSPKVGHHRIRQGLAGAKKALVAACGHNDFLHDLLHTGRSFDARYRRLREARLSRWGRTTCFDLLLRTGALRVGGEHYEPEIAYLGESTGPSAGFRAVWDREVTTEAAPWAEGLLQAWHHHWDEVAERVSAHWSGPPYGPGDLENALCIYQHGR